MSVKIFKRIVQNWHIKLLSVVLAGILWVYVNSIQEAERFLSVPIEIKNISENYLVSNELPEFAQLVLRGREEYLSLINEGEVTAYIDLEQNSVGEARKIVKVDRREIPRGVSIKEIVPRLIDVRLEEAFRKKVKVVPVIVADLPEGYSFVDFSVDPETVEIQGPESILQNTSAVYTEEINIRSLTETTVIDASLEIERDKLTLVDEQSVNVKITIKEEFTLKRVDSVLIYPLNLSEGLVADITGQEVSALVRIPQRLERDFREKQVYAYVDCGSITEPGDYELPLSLQSDVEEVTAVKIEPSSIELHVEEAPAE
jgi:YbbR domain-containing protein